MAAPIARSAEAAGDAAAALRTAHWASGCPAPPWDDEPVPQLGVGRPGKDGLLDVRLGRERPAGSEHRPTVLRAYRHRPPLQMGRLLYPDAACPDLAYGYVAMLSGGLVQGDRLRQRVTVEPGGRAHFTTLAATKIYRMQQNCAAQWLQLTADQEAVLEWCPDPVIPFCGARFWQEVELTVHPQGTLLYSDLLLPGRASAGEQHDYTYYRSRIMARTPDGRLLFADTQALAPPPPGAVPLLATLPASHQILGTAYVLSRSAAVQSLAQVLRETFSEALPAPSSRPAAPSLLPAEEEQRGRCLSSDAQQRAAVLAGCSRLPGDCGIVVRFLAADGQAGRRAMSTIWTSFRREVLGVGAPAVRKL